MRTYDINFKQEAIKLAKEIGSTKAAKEAYKDDDLLQGDFHGRAYAHKLGD